MKIGINASFTRKPQTGIGQVTLNLIESIYKHHPHLDVVLYGEEKKPADMQIPGNWKYSYFLPGWKRDDIIRKIWWEKYLLPRKAYQDQCQVFISPYQCPTKIDAYVKHIMIVHDLIPRIFPEYLNNWRKRHYQNLTEDGIREADHLISVSRKTEKDLVGILGIPSSNITTSHIDVDESFKKIPNEELVSKMLKKYHLESGYILGGGGLEKRKNIEGLIKAYRHLLEDEKKAEFSRRIPDLVIFGATRPELAPLVTDVEKIVRKLNLSERVKLLGSVEKNHLPALYNQAAVFVYPSFYEGFGLPILEAMNQGTAVIASRISSLPEIGGDAVAYCDPKDPGDIAENIRMIITEKEWRDTLAQRGKIRSADFSWKNFTNKLINIVNQN